MGTGGIWGGWSPCLCGGRPRIPLPAAQVEKSSECSAHDCSYELRRTIYGIILKPMQGQESETKGPEVKEWSRNKRSVKESIVQPLWGPVHGHGELPRLDELEKTEVKERGQMLLVSLKADTALIKSLPEKFQLFAASVRYWISNARPGVSQIWVQALLLVHLRLLAESEDQETSPESSDFKKLSRPDFDIDCQHSFAQWQAVMMETIYLNQVLVEPFVQPRLSTLYNGIIAQSIAQEIKQGKKAESFLSTPDIFKQLHTAVTDGLGIDQPTEEGNNESSVEPSEQETAKRRDKKPPKVLQGNKYALLYHYNDESEEES